MASLEYLFIPNFITIAGDKKHLQLSYEAFGLPLGTAPVVLVNHALTGNSSVAGNNGWWSELIGSEKAINTQHYTVLSFNIPGNGYDGTLITNPKAFVTKDIAKIFLKGLSALNIDKVFATIGGSLGGGICWEMAVLAPDLFEHIIPVASHYQSSDWVIANCYIQDQILQSEENGMALARAHAMTLYRTPSSFTRKFERRKNASNAFAVQEWLDHHGRTLEKRFSIQAYRLMNQLLATIDARLYNESLEATLANIQACVHIVTIDSDLLFTREDCKKAWFLLEKLKKNVRYHEIHSIHGHDGFLIEYQQLEKILKPIFNRVVPSNFQQETIKESIRK